MEVTLLYGLIIALIIVLIFLYHSEILGAFGYTKQQFLTRDHLPGVVQREKMGGKIDDITLYERKKRALLDQTSVDNSVHRENREYFESQRDCDGEAPDDNFNGSGLSFSDYVKSAAIDPEMVENHNKYVSDVADRGLFTGRTFSPDMHDSYDPVPWLGLMRPQNVPVGNPDTIPDVDRSVFSNKQTIRWG